MAWIKTVEEGDAHGQLARIYEGMVKRVGRVFNIFKIQSNNPAALKSCIELHAAVMRGESPLSRAQREMIAVVVSKANGCHY